MQRSTAILALTVSLCATSALGAVNVQMQPDGTFYAVVRSSGPPDQKYDIVFLGDGFTAGEQASFNARVEDAANALENMIPYSQRMCRLNIWRVNVVSEESGVDHPAQGTFHDTELNCRYGNPAFDEAERAIVSDSPWKCWEAAGFAPDYQAVFTLVNDTMWGGAVTGDGLVFSSIAPKFAGIITHELGHKIGGLADEYSCYICDGSDDDLTYGGSEPSEVNVTRQTMLAAIKWKDLIKKNPPPPLPTTVDQPVGVVGLWEGGRYHAFDIFRPQLHCHMKEAESAFCAVCERHMRGTLGECTPCEIDPMSMECLLSRLGDKLLTVSPYFCRWRLPNCPHCPVCLNCPFQEMFFEEIVYSVAGTPRDAALKVVDDAGQVVAEGKAFATPTGEPGMQVSFSARRDTQYFIELTSGPIDANVGQSFQLTSTLLRDGVEQKLPSGMAGSAIE